MLIASLGNMAAIRNIGSGKGLVAINAHAMGWGALTSIVLALILGRPFAFSFEPAYLWSLTFLSVFGSAIAFACLLALMSKIGSARAAYTSVLFPIVALSWSTMLEGYQWTLPAFAGIATAMIGNWLALSRVPKRQS